jgi:hypothetical protein
MVSIRTNILTKADHFAYIDSATSFELDKFYL